ncbi:MAG: hypothetical protein L3J53_08665 [Proteobacteria bacterium]|nr:hypothetical protein [Pseudomonadota bacterium]
MEIFNILSRARVNNDLFDFPKTTAINSRVRPKIYDSKSGSVLECAELYKDKAAPIFVFLYG